MKDAYYFSHDSNARHDPKIIPMRGVYGAEGYGWYWILIEMMRDANEYKLDMQGKYTWNAYAQQMGCKSHEEAQQFILDCINEFRLFSSDGNFFWSNSLLRRMAKREKTVESRKNAANARWGKKQVKQGADSKETTNEMQMHSTTNANAMQGKESKGKESKGNIKLKDNTRQQKTYAEDSLYFKMASYFHKLIMEYAESIHKAHLIRESNLQVWADDFRKIVEIDKRDKDEVREVMEWMTNDPFWQGNVLCPDKLRTQYPKLCIAMTKSKGGMGNVTQADFGRRQGRSNAQIERGTAVSDEELDELNKLSESRMHVVQ